MENNGKGIFYGVIGVATLIVAIIGATFAFFSANATVEGNDQLTGGTNQDIGGALSASVVRLDDRGAATAGEGLVPATNDLGTATGITDAATAKCITGGYTGCHLYQISASSSLAIESATLTLDSLSLDGVTNTEDWAYVLYQGDDEKTPTDETIQSKTFDSQGDVLYDDAMTANQEVVWYLLIYIKNDADNAQNATTDVEGVQTPDENNVLGSYSGSITFTAAGGGKVSATFASAG